MLNAGAPWFLAANKKVPITLVNSALSLANQTDTATFANLDYGAPSGASRFVIVCITGEEGTSGLIDVPSATWGGVGLSRITGRTGGTGSTAVGSEIWAGFVGSGVRGDLVVSLNKTASSTENWDSIGVSTLVTNTIQSGSAVDTGVFDRLGGGSSDTASDVATAQGGFMVAVGCSTVFDTGFSSLSGNGANGALTEVVDVGIEGDHRHAVWLLDGTVNQTTEDFTMTNGTGVAAAWTGAVASFL